MKINRLLPILALMFFASTACGRSLGRQDRRNHGSESDDYA